MNAYCTLSQLKTQLGITATTDDTDLRKTIEGTSRGIDNYCKRPFYSTLATRYFDVAAGGGIKLNDDLLSITTMTVDDDGDGTFGETWTEDTHFMLKPFNCWPKYELWVVPYTANTQTLTVAQRALKIIGNWGYGDGESASPWLASGLTITVASTTGTAVTASAAGFVAGQTIRVGTEDMYIEAATTTALTARRGVNGSTAQIHVAVAASIAQYPAPIGLYCIASAARSWKDFKEAGYDSEYIGTYSYRKATVNQQAAFTQRMIGPYVKRIFL